MTFGGGSLPFCSSRNAARRVLLIGLNVDQEHVGRILADLHREVLQQIGLQRADAEDEEGAETDGEQDDARLIAGTRDVQHRLPERERARVAQRLHRAHERETRQMQHERGRDETRPTASARRAAIPPATRRRRRAMPRRAAVTLHFSQSIRASGGMSWRSSSDGLTCRTSSSGTSENSTDTRRPTAKPCTTAVGRQAVLDLEDGGECCRRTPAPPRSRRRQSRRRAGCRRCRAAAPASCTPRESRETIAPTHFRIAMLRSFCCTNTRVTLDTPMPPRISTTRPTRLR